MKAFGVRFAAGALTILFGAYAAALAQKDKQTDPENWEAEAPSLGEPAAPIADIGDESWISQPDTDKENPVQLVQHSEPIAEPKAADMPQGAFGLGAIPENTGNFSADDFNAEAEAAMTATDVAVPDWTMLPPDEAPVEAAGAPAAMTLPSQQPNQMPELEIAKGPAVDFAAAETSGLAADGPATASLGIPNQGPGTPAQAGANPENILRGGPSDANVLRGAPEFDSPQGTEPPPMERWANETAQPGGNSNADQRPDAPSNIDSQTNQLNQPQPVANNGAPGAELMPMNNRSLNQPVDYQQPAGSAAIDPDLSIDAPGDRRLEGAQTPSVVIQKRAPSEVKVGKAATFVIHVQNVGSVEALGVKVHDKIPSGMELVDASPRPVQQGNSLLWQLGAMPAGDEQTITMQLVPRQEGELGSVARVSFEAAASVRTIATRPELKIVQKAPETVLIGQQLEIELEVSNPGTGEATNVVLQEDVPEGLEHPRGRQLDNALGNLAPGEVRRQVLRMKAVAPGIVQNTIHLTGDDGLASEHSVKVQVVAPELRVDLEGPSRRFLERQATYYVHVGNVGTADANNVELSVHLDRGFTFVSTEHQGQYDPSRHTVHWSVAQMPAGGNGKVALTLLPVQEGEQAITLDVRADLGIVAKNERRLLVEGFSELSFSITNPGGPIELGSETTYEIKVNNSGSKADSNVQVQVQLPAGLELISSQGDAGTDGRGLVAFQPKASLSPGGEQAYKIRVKGVAPGTHIVKAIVVSDLATTPVTKEESTVVYADR